MNRPRGKKRAIASARIIDCHRADSWEDGRRTLPTAMRISFFAVAVCFIAAANLFADDPPPHRMSADDMAAEASALKYQTGTISLKDGLATINLKPGYRFLDGPQAEKVLHDLWGNPPADPPLGMIFPPNLGPLDDNSWSVVVEYDDNGHVNDDDAAKINNDDLLKSMQKSVQEENDERQKEGYSAMELVGWAQPPHYDAATHKLYWAKNLRVIGDENNSLNYNIRVLGRKGVLDLDAVAMLRDLNEVSAKMPEVMAMVDFQPGNTYAEFDPRVDKVAKYGIAALVAGTAVGLAAKAGLLKFLFPLLLLLKKAGIFIVVAIIALVKKIGAAIRGRSSVARPFDPPKAAPDPAARNVPATPTLNPPPDPNKDPLRPPPNPPV
jgi:uncharacterized membrane-anchored protein